MPRRKQAKPKPKKRESTPADKPISLAPLSFEEVVRGLAQVKPEKKK